MGFVAEAALIALREGLEAFLIVGILLGFLTRLNRPDGKKWVWIGLAAGVAVSLAVGLLVQLVILDAFEAAGGGEWFELVAALAAVVVLTYMVFWMWQNTRTLMAGIRKKVGQAVDKNTLWVVALLTFLAVVREGLEVVLFYAALAGGNSAFDLAWSGLLGAAFSVLIVLAIFKTSVSLNLPKFFAFTGILLVFIAAGLLVHSVHAAMDLGLLPHMSPIWDTSGFLSDDSAMGRILHALVGYAATPNILQAVAYFGYLFGVGIPYLASLGAFRRRETKTVRKGAVVAVVLLVWIASVGVAFAAANPLAADEHETGHDAAHQAAGGIEHPELLANATAALEAYDGKVGILVRDHGEMVHYNASTYESIKEFVINIWPYTGLPEQMLYADHGTYFLDEANPFEAQPQNGARLVDAWVSDWDQPAVPVGDPAESGALESFCDNEPLYYFVPGTGPGAGEGDLLEMIGLCAYRTWLKMDNYSPRHDQGLASWDYLETHLKKHFGDRVVVAFAHGVDPKMDPNHTYEAAAERFVGEGVTVVLDAYQSSVHSDSMNTCMMAPHAEHVLRAAGFDGEILPVGMAGHQAAWGKATADYVEELLADVDASVPVSIHLSQHGATPGSQNPCGDGADQYHENLQRQFELASAAVLERMEDRGNVTLRHVYGQGAGTADDGVLSPTEALDLDVEEGMARTIIIPYEFWGDAMDNLVNLRESLGYEPEQSPYYDSDYETRFTYQGVSVHIASAEFSTEAKSDAQLAAIGLTMESLPQG